MKKILDYFELYLKEKAEKRGLQKALKEIGLHASSVKNYREGSVPRDESLVKLAKKLDIDPIEILAVAGYERAKNIETKKEWKRLYMEIEKNKTKSEKIKETLKK